MTRFLDEEIVELRQHVWTGEYAVDYTESVADIDAWMERGERESLIRDLRSVGYWPDDDLAGWLSERCADPVVESMLDAAWQRWYLGRGTGLERQRKSLARAMALWLGRPDPYGSDADDGPTQLALVIG